MKLKQNLRECAAFGELTDADLEKIADLCVMREHNAGSMLFQEGDSAEDFFIVQEGKVAVQMTLPTGGPNGKKATVDIAQANDVLGWASIIGPKSHTITAVCLQKTRVLAISGSKLKSLFDNNHSAAYEVLEGLARVMASRLDDTRRLLISERSWLQ